MYIYTLIHIYTYIHKHVYMHKCAYLHTHVYAYVSIIHMYLSTYIHIHIIYIHVNIYTCKFIQAMENLGGSETEQRLATRIEFSNSMSPRQLGTVKTSLFTLATKCRGDSVCL